LLFNAQKRGRRPTSACSRPLRARDRCYFELILCSALAAADAQAVGLLLRNLILCRSSRCNAIAPCPIACQSASRVPIPPERHRFLPIVCQTPSSMPTSPHSHRGWPTRMQNVVAPAHLASASSRHARLACEISSRLPISPQPHRAMLTRVRNGILNDASSPTSACS